jgi:hypothetical protein
MGRPSENVGFTDILEPNVSGCCGGSARHRRSSRNRALAAGKEYLNTEQQDD